MNAYQHYNGNNLQKRMKYLRERCVLSSAIQAIPTKLISFWNLVSTHTNYYLDGFKQKINEVNPYTKTTPIDDFGEKRVSYKLNK